jgi:hypothetical protein
MRYLNDCLNSIQFLGRLCLLCSIFFMVLQTYIFVYVFLNFCCFFYVFTYLFKILNTLDWLYVSCSIFVTNWSREALCHLLISLWELACFFCIQFCLLASFNLAISCTIFSLHLLIVLFDYPIFVDTFSCFVPIVPKPSYAADFSIFF